MALETGDYLHNRMSLFRFEGFLPRDEGVLLEDCWTGLISSYSLRAFVELKLSRVKREEHVAHGDR